MKTLIVGASTNPERYAFKAANSLLKHGHGIVLLGSKAGEIDGHIIHTEPQAFKNVDTVTLYINPKNQEVLYDYIISLLPRRVIFNPGTENPVFEEILQLHNIVCEESCTLVMLSIGTF